MLEPGIISDGQSLIAAPTDSESHFSQREKLDWEEVDESKKLRRRAERDGLGLRSSSKQSKSDSTQNPQNSIKVRHSTEGVSRDTFKTHNGEFPGKMNQEKRTRLKSRQETPGEVQLDAEQLKTLHDDYKTYVREYLGERNKDKRVKLQSGIGTKEEIQRMNTFREAHNAYYRVISKKYQAQSKQQAPEKVRPRESERLEAEQAGTEQLDALHEAYATYVREFTGPENKAKTAKLKSGKGPREEIERMERLREAHNIYVRLNWRKQNRIKLGRDEFGYFTDEEIEQLKTLRGDSQAFQREYVSGPSAKDRRLKLESGQGTRPEIERMERLRVAYKTYKKIIQAGRGRGRTTSLELETSLAEDLKQLEALREDRNTFAREFLGDKNIRKKANLEAGQGSRQEIERMKRLREAYNTFQNLYQKCLRKAKKAKITEYSQETPSEEIDNQTQIRIIGGHAKYFKPIHEIPARDKEQNGKGNRKPEQQDLDSVLDSEAAADHSIREALNDNHTDDSKGTTQRVRILTGDGEHFSRTRGGTQPSSGKNFDEASGQLQLSQGMHSKHRNMVTCLHNRNKIIILIS